MCLCLFESMEITYLGACKAENTESSFCLPLFYGFMVACITGYYALYDPGYAVMRILTAILPLFSTLDNQLR